MNPKFRNNVAYLKLIYLYLSYFIVGLTEEGFQYQKALYLSELGYYHAAIRALKKAEKDLNTSYVHGLIGWCYIQLECFEKALSYYRKAYEQSENPEIILGLAVSELHAGDLSNSKEFYQRVLPFRHEKEFNYTLNLLEAEYAKIPS